MDIQAHKKRVLIHCMEMAKLDERYAIWAAEQYEIKSSGMLDGLHAKVLELREKRNDPKAIHPTTHRPRPE